MTRRALLPLALAAVAVFVVRAAHGASIRQMTLDEVIDHASEIVVGDVVSSDARWQGRLVVTTSRVRVEESLKGQPAAEIEVSQLGGTAVHPVLGVPVSMTVSSYVALQPGEKVVLFLEETRPRVRQLVGAQQGKLVLREEPETGARDLPVGPKQLRVFREGERETLMRDPMTFEGLRRRIRGRLAGGGGQR